ncbi:hypothetical protein L1D15_21710 [Vibrio sp. Isolate25]|uniref:DUF3472 domain-containing protein n=1 Tax=Vibrio sp. Isolate25 TaxID=2908535 RepID=UPI001EFD375E|nr:hypothetical protein [Vibrio sp. Isolate25]MCG9599310.1 hypothetical protein [Vibrio sp. Isolate25]
MWPFLVVNSGSFQADVALITDSSNSEIEVTLTEQQSGHTVSTSCVTHTNNDEESDAQWRITYDGILTEGYYKLSFNAINVSAGEVGTLKRVMLSGSSIENSHLIRARWRPIAVHASFESSTLPSNEKGLLWVFETEQLTTGGNSYSPISTPFGYIGSTRDKETRVPSGYNFSLWAFGSSETPLPFIDMPHILTAGSMDARFSWYGHEGTGVKIRDWDPYASETNPIQLLGYRLQQGVEGAISGSPKYYDTFSSYFFKHDSHQWHLFGRARDTLNPTINSNVSSAFVKVTGAADVERSGHIPRTVSFKGWVYGSDGQWHIIDRMQPTGSMGSEEAPLTKAWSITPEGDAFTLSQTGLAHFSTTNNVLTLTEPKDVPEHIIDKTDETFASIPLDIKLKTTNIVSDETKIEIEFDISQVTDNTLVRLFYGPQNSLTYTESITGKNDVSPYEYEAWSHYAQMNSEELSEGLNTITISGLDSNQTYYFRAFSENETGKTWSDRYGRKVPIEDQMVLSTDYTTSNQAERKK